MRALCVLALFVWVGLLMGQGCLLAAPPPDDNPPVNNPPDDTPPPDNTPPPNTPAALPSAVIAVRANATGANNGSNWTDAYTDLQDALAAARVPGSNIQQIWVAKGTYKPAGVGGDRAARFLLINDVTIYGGFAGTESQLTARDISANPTILSGDLNGDDGPNFANNTDNSNNVVVANNLMATAILDGFTIQAGNGDQGSGLRMSIGGSVTIRNCIFNENRSGQGGAVFVFGPATPVFIGCTFRGNRSTPYNGGALLSFSSDVQLTGCTFIGNFSSETAGALEISDGTGRLTNCTFSDNTAAESGGAIYNYGAEVEVTACTFQNNSALTGGAVFCLAASVSQGSFHAINSIFRRNNATEGDGGAIDDKTDRLELFGCVFDRNQADGTGGGVAEHGNRPRILNCTFSGNSAGLGGGVYLQGGSYEILNCIAWGNTDSSQFTYDSQIRYESASVAPARTEYCDIQGLDLANPGIGNIGSDPLFVDAANGDLHLKTGSPCVNTGNNTHVPSQLTTDLDGDPRIRGTPLTVDMGADEQ